MKFYECRKEFTLKPKYPFSYDDIYNITCPNTYPGSILTEEEFYRLKTICRPFPDDIFIQTDIPKDLIYYFFGLRFYRKEALSNVNRQKPY